MTYYIQNTINILKSFRNYYHDSFVYFILALIVFYWFGNAEYLFGVDTIFPINMEYINEYFYLWANNTSYSGVDIFKLPVLFPYMYILKFINDYTISINTQILERICIYLLIFVGGYGINLLLKELYKETGGIIRLLVSIFYLFNVYTVYLLTPVPYYLLYSYFMFPAALFLFIRYVVNKTSLLKAFLAGVISYSMLSVSYATTPYILIHLAIFTLFFLASVLFNKLELQKFHKIKLFITFLMGFFAFAVFWIYVFITQPDPPFKTVVSLLDTGLSSYKLNSVDLAGVLRLQGYFGFNSDYKGYMFYSWYDFFLNPFVIIFTFTFSLVSLSGLYIKPLSKKSTTNYITGLIIFMVFAFLLTFSSYKIGAMLEGLFKALNFYDYFRSAYQRFTAYIVLAFAITIPYSLSAFYNANRTNNVTRTVFSVFFLCLVAFCAFPLLTKDIFIRNEIFPGKEIIIPSNYRKLASELETKDKGKNTLVLPFNKIGLYSLNWENSTMSNGYDGVYPLVFMGTKRFIYSDSLQDEITGLLDAYESTDLPINYLLTLLNIDSIILHKDANWPAINGNSFWHAKNFSEIESKLRAEKCLTVNTDNSNILLFDVKSECQDDTVGTSFVSGIYNSNGIDNSDFLKFASKTKHQYFSKAYNQSVNDIVIASPVDDYLSLYFDRSKYAIPNASISPDSWLYKFIEYKENYKVGRSFDTPLDKVDILLWFASKRLVELSEFNISGSQRDIAMKKTENNINLIYDIISSVENKTPEFYRLIDKVLFYLDSKNYKLSKLEVDYLQSVYTKFEKLVKHNASCNFDYCYEFIITYDGTYNILFSKDVPIRNFDVSLDGIIIKNLDKVRINKGKHLLVVSSKDPKYLVKNEQIKQVSYRQSGEVIDKKDFIVFNKEIENFTSVKDYYLSFQYKLSKGELLYSISQLNAGSDQKNESKVYVLNEGKLLNNDNRDFAIKFTPDSFVTGSIGVVNLIVNIPKKNNESAVEINDLSLYEREKLDVALESISNISESATDIKYRRINPVLYKVQGDLKKSTILILHEKFDVGWHLYYKDNTKEYNLLDLVKHIGAEAIFQEYYLRGYKKIDVTNNKLNNINNSWILDKDLDEVYIYYSPQNNLYIGIFVLSLNVVVVLISALYFLFRIKSYKFYSL